MKTEATTFQNAARNSALRVYSDGAGEEIIGRRFAAQHYGLGLLPWSPFAGGLPVRGRALIDRELYLPKSWTTDRDRCVKAAVPDDVQFAIKPQHARAMIERAVAAGVPFAWFTADEAFGQNPGLGSGLRNRISRM